MTLETFIKQLRKAAGRGNNSAEVKFYHYNELMLTKVEQGKEGEVMLVFNKPLTDGWEENFLLAEMQKPLAQRQAEEEARAAAQVKTIEVLDVVDI